MFPFVRFAYEIVRVKSLPPLAHPTETHVSHHICWPWDLDQFLELNNGRALTLFDLGRFGLAERMGLLETLRRERWGLTIAGSSVRYRRRIRGMERFTMRSRAVCFDDRFMYLEQSTWRTDGECAHHALYRSAATDQNGIVAPSRLMEAMGQSPVSPEMPDWIAQWVRAEGTRPWPPMQSDLPI